MKTRVKAVAAALVTCTALVGALWLPAGSASADDDECSLSTIEGIYGSRQTGTLNGAPITQLNRVVADGQGRFTGRGTLVVDGVVTSLTFTARYTVNADCTGMLTTSTGVTQNLVIAQDGSFVQFIVTFHPAGPATISGDATRLNDGDN